MITQTPVQKFISLVDDSPFELSIVHDGANSYAINKDRCIIHALVGANVMENVMLLPHSNWILTSDNTPLDTITDNKQLK